MCSGYAEADTGELLYVNTADGTTQYEFPGAITAPPLPGARLRARRNHCASCGGHGWRAADDECARMRADDECARAGQAATWAKVPQADTAAASALEEDDEVRLPAPLHTRIQA